MAEVITAQIVQWQHNQLMNNIDYENKRWAEWLAKGLVYKMDKIKEYTVTNQFRIQDSVDKVSKQVDTLGKNIGAQLSNSIRFLNKNINSMSDRISTSVERLDDVVSRFQSNVNYKFDEINTIIRNSGEGVKHFVKIQLKEQTNKMTNGFSNTWKKITKSFDDTTSFIQDKYVSTKNFIAGNFANLKDVFSEKIDAVKKLFGEGISTIIQIVRDMIQKLIDMFLALYQDFKDTITEAVSFKPEDVAKLVQDSVGIIQNINSQMSKKFGG